MVAVNKSKTVGIARNATKCEMRVCVSAKTFVCKIDSPADVKLVSVKSLVFKIDNSADVKLEGVPTCFINVEVPGIFSRVVNELCCALASQKIKIGIRHQ